MKFEMNADDVPALTAELEAAAAESRRKRRKAVRGSKTGPAAVKRRARDANLVEMRAQGKTLQECADTLGFNSKQAAQQALERALSKREVSAAELLRQSEGARLETAVGVVMGIITEEYDAVGVAGLEMLDALDGYERNKYIDAIVERIGKNAELKLKAMDRLVSLGGRAGKVFGYDAPTKLEGNGMGGNVTVMFDGAMAKPIGMAEPELIIEPQV